MEPRELVYVSPGKVERFLHCNGYPTEDFVEFVAGLERYDPHAQKSHELARKLREGILSD